MEQISTSSSRLSDVFDPYAPTGNSLSAIPPMSQSEVSPPLDSLQKLSLEQTPIEPPSYDDIPSEVFLENARKASRGLTEQLSFMRDQMIHCFAIMGNECEKLDRRINVLENNTQQIIDNQLKQKKNTSLPQCEDCPICHLQFEISEIEKHVDACLINENKREYPEFSTNSLIEYQSSLVKNKSNFSDFLSFWNKNRTMRSEKGGWHTIRVGSEPMTSGNHRFSFFIDKFVSNSIMIAIVDVNWKTGVNLEPPGNGQGGVSFNTSWSVYFADKSSVFTTGDNISVVIHVERKTVDFYKNAVLVQTVPTPKSPKLKLLVGVCNFGPTLSIVQNMNIRSGL